MAEARGPAAATLLAVARDITDGHPVDWSARAHETGEEGARALASLRAVEELVTAFRHNSDHDPAGDAAAGIDAGDNDAVTLPPEELFTWGPLRVRAKIGEGSFGEVFRAYDPALDREVALKLRRPGPSDEQASGRRFLEEGRRLARIRHPHVVTVHGAAIHDARVGLWTDRIAGMTLRELVEEHGPMAAREAALVGADLCQALAAVHDAEIVHGDVKPDNVMRERGGRIVLMDFGAGAWLDPRSRTTTAIAGTWALMAPEVRERRVLSPAADIYSLGALLYFLVSGSYPEDGPATGERDRPVPLRERRPDLPESFIAVVDRALAPDPADRFSGPGTMERALRSAAGARESPAASPPRRRRARTAWAFAGVVAVIVTGGGAWLASRHHDAPRVVAHGVVSAFPGNHGEATFSPDGELLAFVSDAAGTPQIWVKGIERGEPVQVTAGEAAASSPSWTAAGEILFARAESGIWAVPAVGGEPRQLVADGTNPHAARRAPTFVFERGQEIWLGDLGDAGAPRRIEAVPRRVMAWVAAEPALSPDGTKVAYFFQEVGPLGDFWVADLASGRLTRLTNDLSQGGDPTWSADGRQVIFWSLRGGSRNLWVVPATGGRPTALTTGAGEDTDPAISPDGLTVTFTNTRNRWSLAVLDLASGTERRLLERHHPFQFPTPSPADDRIAFFQDIGADTHVFTVRPDGSGLRQITQGSPRINAHPAWSPDGRWLYYYRIHPQPGLRRIPSQGGVSEEVVAGWHVDRQPEARIDPTGRLVAYLDQDADRGTTKIRDLASGRERALAAPHLHSLSWLPDGKALVGWQHGDVIAVCPVSGDPCRPLTSGHRPRLAPDGEHVVFSRPTASDDAWDVWRLHLPTGREERVATAGPLARISTEIAVLPGALAFSRLREERREIWRVELDRPLR